MASAIALPGASGALVDLPGASVIKYFGISVRETAAAVAVVRIREGGSTGKILDVISLAASASANTWYGPQGLMCASDILYFEKVSGTVEGSVRIG